MLGWLLGKPKYGFDVYSRSIIPRYLESEKRYDFSPTTEKIHTNLNRTKLGMFIDKYYWNVEANFCSIPFRYFTVDLPLTAK